MSTPAAPQPGRRPDRSLGSDPDPAAGTAGSVPLSPDDEVGARFAAHVGVRVGPAAGLRAGCGATATLTGPQAWSEQGDSRGPGDDGPVPTGAVLALVDATARQAAELALGGPDHRATLVPMATGVQYRVAAGGMLSASATVPCEGPLSDRADDQGVLRFSVAVDVVDAAGNRVATGTVQWLATVTPPPPPDPPVRGLRGDPGARR